MEPSYDVSRNMSAGGSSPLPPAMLNRRKPLVAEVPSTPGYTHGVPQYRNYESTSYKTLQGW